MRKTRVKEARGFTLLELLMVVIIIAILASLALPQYLKTTERARMAEAMTMLGALRSAEIRYFAQHDVFTPDVSGITCVLDVCGDDVSGTPHYTFAGAVTGGPSPTFDISAQRIGGTPPGPCVVNYKVHIYQDSVISGQDCLSAL